MTKTWNNTVKTEHLKTSHVPFPAKPKPTTNDIYIIYMYILYDIHEIIICKYTNTEQISAVKRAFNNYSKKITTTKVITTILALIFTLK